MLRSQKIQFVSDLEYVCQSSDAIFVVHYRGMSVLEISNLKKSLKSKLIKFKVVKNTLIRIAAKNVGKDYLSGMFVGPVAIVYSNDIVSAAKLLNNFAQTNDKLKIIGGSIYGKLVNFEDINNISKLPSFDEIKSKLIATIQNPAQLLSRLIKSPADKFVGVLKAYVNKNQNLN